MEECAKWRTAVFNCRRRAATVTVSNSLCNFYLFMQICFASIVAGRGGGEVVKGCRAAQYLSLNWQNFEKSRKNILIAA